MSKDGYEEAWYFGYAAGFGVAVVKRTRARSKDLYMPWTLFVPKWIDPGSPIESRFRGGFADGLRDRKRVDLEGGAGGC